MQHEFCCVNLISKSWRSWKSKQITPTYFKATVGFDPTSRVKKERNQLHCKSNGLLSTSRIFMDVLQLKIRNLMAWTIVFLKREPYKNYYWEWFFLQIESSQQQKSPCTTVKLWQSFSGIPSEKDDAIQWLEMAQTLTTMIRRRPHDVILQSFERVSCIWVQLQATSHTRLKARDHCILRSLVGQKGWDLPNSLHTRGWRPKGPKKLSWMKCLLDFYMAHHVNWIASMAFRWESRALTITWSQSLARVWSGHKFHDHIVSALHVFANCVHVTKVSMCNTKTTQQSKTASSSFISWSMMVFIVLD